MATRYLIGRGELLTYQIEAPRKKPSDKGHPYSLAEAKAHVVPQMESAAQALQQLPANACPDDIAVARMTLHPAYLAKSYFGGSSRPAQPPRNPVRFSGTAGPPVVEIAAAFVDRHHPDAPGDRFHPATCFGGCQVHSARELPRIAIAV